jgi:polyisoprenyl-teichoic acid--peptidoglycan teichoic acid transferase
MDENVNQQPSEPDPSIDDDQIADRLTDPSTEQIGEEGHSAAASLSYSLGQLPADPSQREAFRSSTEPDSVKEPTSTGARVGQAASPPAAAPRAASVTGDKPPRRPRLWLRFLIASLLIVTTTAAATSISIIDYLGGIAHALAHNGRLSPVDKFLARGYSGGPQTILLIGSDQRPNSSTSKNGLSDTVLLVRLDPDQGSINMLSIPRDLKVDIPGYGVGKFNAAYSDGGPELSLRTLKQVTGLSVNHLFVVDFKGFASAVDAIGCVYVDVDRLYYHSNEGLPLSEQYSEINIPPGYQKLCGKRALEFVRYRHTDTDLVREARQQQFLRDARQMVPTEQLIDQRTQLINIFTKYTTSDLHSTEQLLELLKLSVELREDSIKQISFPAILEPVVENQPDYVTASPGAIHQVVRQFLGLQTPLSSGRSQHLAKSGGVSKPPSPGEPRASTGLTEATDAGAQMASGGSGRLNFSVFYPRKLPNGSTYAEAMRTYRVRDEAGHRHLAYRMVMELPTPAYTAYFGVQGIGGWPNPPILNGPSQSLTLNGRHFEVFRNGGHIRLIAWHDGENVYWIANSLVQVLGNDQMLGVARSLAELRPNR